MDAAESSLERRVRELEKECRDQASELAKLRGQMNVLLEDRLRHQDWLMKHGEELGYQKAGQTLLADGLRAVRKTLDRLLLRRGRQRPGIETDAPQPPPPSPPSG